MDGETQKTGAFISELNGKVKEFIQTQSQNKILNGDTTSTIELQWIHAFSPVAVLPPWYLTISTL